MEQETLIQSFINEIQRIAGREGEGGDSEDIDGGRDVVGKATMRLKRKERNKQRGANGEGEEEGEGETMIEERGRENDR